MTFSIMAVVVAAFIVIACAATLRKAGIRDVASAADGARALEPLAGRWAKLLFAFGLANASLFAACILPLATAYSVCEGLGLEAGVNKRFGDAPEFYWLYTAIMGIGAGMVLVPGVPLLRVILVSQVLNGLLLPFILVFMVLLVNRKELMGDFTNGPVYNGITWTTTAVLVVLAVMMLASSFIPGGSPAF